MATMTRRRDTIVVLGVLVHGNLGAVEDRRLVHVVPDEHATV